MEISRYVILVDSIMANLKKLPKDDFDRYLEKQLLDPEFRAGFEAEKKRLAKERRATKPTALSSKKKGA